MTDFDFTAQPGIDERLIRELATLRFLDDAGGGGDILFSDHPAPAR